MFPLFRLAAADLTARPQILEQHYTRDYGKILPQEWTALSRREQAVLCEGWRWGAQPEWIKRKLADQQLAIRTGIHAGTVGGVSHYVARVLQQDIRPAAARGGGKGARYRRSVRRKLAGVHPGVPERPRLQAQPTGPGRVEQHVIQRPAAIVRPTKRAEARQSADPITRWKAGEPLVFTRTGFGGPITASSKRTERRGAAEMPRSEVPGGTFATDVTPGTGAGVGRMHPGNFVEGAPGRGTYSLDTTLRGAVVAGHAARLAGLPGLPPRISNPTQAAHAIDRAAGRSIATASRLRPHSAPEGGVHIGPIPGRGGYVVQQYRGGRWHTIATYDKQGVRR